MGMHPPTPQVLMRSRYTAYTQHNADYIYTTTHPAERRHHNKKEILAWAKSCHWLKLDVLKADGNTVVFKAYYLDSALRPQVHYEHSFFEMYNGKWYYKKGEYY
ncbi:YchJ family protein [Flavobacterium sp. RHBU_24]|uniref:YchJ family protein n=1 Tax=Flavobacterium sp. RHBU_24 TaxID=3391185 RepID=UPI003984BD70